MSSAELVYSCIVLSDLLHNILACLNSSKISSRQKSTRLGDKSPNSKSLLRAKRLEGQALRLGVKRLGKMVAVISEESSSRREVKMQSKCRLENWRWRVSSALYVAVSVKSQLALSKLALSKLRLLIWSTVNLLRTGCAIGWCLWTLLSGAIEVDAWMNKLYNHW